MATRSAPPTFSKHAVRDLDEDEDDAYVASHASDDDVDDCEDRSPVRAKKGARKRANQSDEHEDEDDLDDQQPGATKKPRGSVAFEKRLAAFSSTQLAHALTALVFDSQTVSESTVVALLPGIDMDSIKAALLKANRAMHRAFPHSRWGTNRDAYALRRVKPFIVAFDKLAKESIRRLVAAKAWQDIIAFEAWFVRQCPYPDGGAFQGAGKAVTKLLDAKVAMAKKKVGKK